ncbi:MAG: 4Fe-4S dicluster domain-containing protein [Firmicutes bacterium]|nr:4Fe-4S dicluster domain-containing protein [Bacillota bacterium]
MSSTVLKSTSRRDSIQKYTWPFTLVVAVGGLWWPRLGLLVLPIMLSLAIISFFRGRFWCGNVCSHGSLYDFVLGPFSRHRNIPRFLKSPVMVWFFFGFFGYNITRRVVAVAGLWGTQTFWDRLGFIFVISYLMVLLVGGTLAVFIRPRTWCNFCPMGTMEKLSYKLGKLSGVAARTDQKVTISDLDKCRACGKCAKVCPMQLSPHLGFADTGQFEHEDCIRCGACVEACPFNLLSISKASSGF